MAERGTVIRILQGLAAMACHEGEICALFATVAACGWQRRAASHVIYRVWLPWGVMREIYVRYLRGLLIVGGREGYHHSASGTHETMWCGGLTSSTYKWGTLVG